MLKKFNNGQINVGCVNCGNTFDTTVPNGFEPKFLEEFGQYENLIVRCPICKEKGTEVTIHINLNIPEGEMDEEDLEFEMPAEEINARKYVRDLMWQVRPDLKTKDRSEFNANRQRIPREIIEFQKKRFGDFDAKLPKPGIEQ